MFERVCVRVPVDVHIPRQTMITLMIECGVGRYISMRIESDPKYPIDWGYVQDQALAHIDPGDRSLASDFGIAPTSLLSWSTIV